MDFITSDSFAPEFRSAFLVIVCITSSTTHAVWWKTCNCLFIYWTIIITVAYVLSIYHVIKTKAYPLIFAWEHVTRSFDFETEIGENFSFPDVKKRRYPPSWVVQNITGRFTGKSRLLANYPIPRKRLQKKKIRFFDYIHTDQTDWTVKLCRQKPLLWTGIRLLLDLRTLIWIRALPTRTIILWFMAMESIQGDSFGGHGELVIIILCNTN